MQRSISLKSDGVSGKKSWNARSIRWKSRRIVLRDRAKNRSGQKLSELSSVRTILKTSATLPRRHSGGSGKIDY